MRSLRSPAKVALMVFAALPMPLLGQSLGGVDIVTLNSPNVTQGARTVNAASGVNNQQANVGLVASGGSAIVVGVLHQDIATTAPAGGRPAQAQIEPGAFADSHGWTAINAVAGADNQQANLAIIATGIEGFVLTDTMLGQTRASQQPPGSQDGATPAPDRSVGLGEGAFAGGSGLVQLSLVGGDRNSSANTFALSVLGIANPQ